jgi:hypothetical protein
VFFMTIFYFRRKDKVNHEKAPLPHWKKMLSD